MGSLPTTSWRRAARWANLAVLCTGVLVLLVLGASALLERLLYRWHVRDVALRSRLAVEGREALTVALRAHDSPRLARILESIARDERILGAAACSPEGSTLARTPLLPEELSCDTWRPADGPPADHAGEAGGDRHALVKLHGGEVHVSALPVADADGPTGWIVIAHDMSFLARRNTDLQLLVLFGLAVIVVALAALAFGLGRRYRHQWVGEVRELLGNATDAGTLRAARGSSDLGAIAEDVRQLVARMATESEIAAGGHWTAERLKRTLTQHVHGDQLLVVANREPYIHEHADDGGIRVLHPASGLVTGVEPVMRACSGTWIAHGSGSADRESSDRHGRLRVPPHESSYLLRRVWLSSAQEGGYYYGFANEGLWPLCHLADEAPIFRESDWRHYVAVNELFAQAVQDEADRDDPIVLVQDYHFALLPRLLRERMPRATVLTFWHVPWPNAERFAICPWGAQLLSGMLGSDILGFHTQLHCNNFLESVDRLLEARADRERFTVTLGGEVTSVRPYPISVEWPSRWLQAAPPVDECRRAVFAELGMPASARLGVGVDRIDYTKGIVHRLLAIETLLERHESLRGSFTFAQVGAPSRTKIPRYQALRAEVENVVERINRRFARDDWRPVVLRAWHHEPPEVLRFLRAADVCYVSSLHDGMNLVAKEFVSARDDEHGVLVLSQFTGASRELPEALIVNPHDLEQVAAALALALAMPRAEQRARMRSMRSFVSEANVYRWAGRMLIDAARHRERARLADRVAGSAG